jgi:hypothetical protein
MELKFPTLKAEGLKRPQAGVKPLLTRRMLPQPRRGDRALCRPFRASLPVIFSRCFTPACVLNAPSGLRLQHFMRVGNFSYGTSNDKLYSHGGARSGGFAIRPQLISAFLMRNTEDLSRTVHTCAVREKLFKNICIHLYLYHYNIGADPRSYVCLRSLGVKELGGAAYSLTP